MSKEAQKAVEDCKERGNRLFQQSKLDEAIEAYSDGIDAWEEGLDPNLKAVLLSNRAACHLKRPSGLQDCINDCTKALDILQTDDNIRCKLLFRRAKASFLLSEAPLHADNKELMENAAKDLLTLLSIDKENKQAAILLQTIRAKHGLTKGTPISQTLAELQKELDDKGRSHQMKLLLGLLTNDSSAAMELGRRGGVALLMRLGGLQVLACACSNLKFVQEYGKEIDQAQLLEFVKQKDDKSLYAMSVWLRLVLYLDELDSLDETSLLNDALVMETCIEALGSSALLPASLNLLSSWTAVDREDVVQASTDTTVMAKKTEAELRTMKPREVAGYKKQQYERMLRDQKWAKDRAMLFCQEGGLQSLLNAAIECKSHVLRKQIGIAIGRLMASIQDDEDIEKISKEFLGSANDLTIEEISDEKAEDEINQSLLVQMMKRAQFTSSLLLGKPDVGSSALMQIKHELRELLESGDPEAMSIASEVVSAGASVEKSRPVITSMLNDGALEMLLQHSDRDIRSGAASAVAKLGLADKMLSANEGEVMGLLQIAVELLYDESDSLESEVVDKLTIRGHPGEHSVASTCVERGVEVLAYLASKTQVKEELAHGFRSSSGEGTALERLVGLANLPAAGESISAYALASVFSLTAVSFETLRREAFVGKEITMEQYDELQSLGKTQEEKEMIPVEPDDTNTAVEERITLMANANVPKAMVNLMEDASESTLEQLAIGLNRMAINQSTRGLLIQQGVLSCCIKLEKGSDASEVSKNTLRQARHCVAKLLVTTNPSLLTNSQRMGSIKPLMELIRDTESTSLQQFESLLAITNLAGLDEETKERIVSERGISTLNYAMFSDHEMVKRAATEALCNLVPHPAMMKHLAEPENLKLWMAFAADYEVNFECSRAAVGCLAMSTYDPKIGSAMVGLASFRDTMMSLLESGDLELMHRVLVLIQNLVEQGGECQEGVVAAGLVSFCSVYVESYHDGAKAAELNFSPEQQGQLDVTVELAKQIVELSK